MSWIVGHLGGGLLAIAGHVATSGFGWLKERTRAGEVENIEQAAVQRASYRHADWEHFVLTVLLVGLMIWAHVTGQPEGLQGVTEDMALASVAWFTGRLTLRRVK